MQLDFFFDKAKKMLDKESESSLARTIGLTPQELYRARKDGWIKTEVLVKLAEITGDDLEVIILAREADRTQDEQTKAALENSVFRIMQRAKQAGGILAIGALMMSGSRSTADNLNTDLTFTNESSTATALYYRK